MVRKVEVIRNDPNWSKMFREEGEEIATILVQELVAVHQDGDTAISNISAKPIIDILVEVHDIEKIDAFNEDVIELGYEPKVEFGISWKAIFRQGQRPYSNVPRSFVSNRES